MIDMQRFCAVDDALSVINRPFVLDGHKVATNRVIIVRVPIAGGANDVGLNDRLITAFRGMFSVVTDESSWRAMPEVGAPIECGFCDGSGVIDDAPEPDNQCFACDGTGETDRFLRVGPATFNARVLRAIADLPNVRISVTSDLKAAAFEFDGGEGRIMPMRQGAKERN